MDKIVDMVSLSVVNITKNSEDCIGDVVRNALQIGDEIIVVDTGSRDNTREIASQAGAKVVQFEGSFDYSKPRNLGMEHATGEWILQLDTDERINPEARRRIRTQIGTTKSDLVLVPQIRDNYSPGNGIMIQPRLIRKGRAGFEGKVFEWTYPLRKATYAHFYLQHSPTQSEESKNGSRKKLANRELDGIYYSLTRPITSPAEYEQLFSRLRMLVTLSSQPLLTINVANRLYQDAVQRGMATPKLTIEGLQLGHRIGDTHMQEQFAIKGLWSAYQGHPKVDQGVLLSLAQYFVPNNSRATVELMTRSLEIEPNSQTYFLKGIAEHLQGNKKQAKSDFNMARELFPDFPSYQSIPML